jgi:hypothetical protein
MSADAAEISPFADPEPEEPVAASMSMTKAELLDRLHEHEDGLTKAELLERIHQFEGGESEPSAPATPMDTATRSATVDGVMLTWTEATQDTVPQAYRDIYAQSKAAGG